MSKELINTLYRTRKNIREACNDLGIPYSDDIVEDIGDLTQCNICSIWYYGYELLPDDNGLDTCKFCTSYYNI